MSSALKGISVQQYLDRERQSPSRSEFFEGEMFAMAGGSAMHSLIAANFVREAGNALKNKPCVVFNSDLRVLVLATGLHTYPDATVVCGPLEFEDECQDTLTNPTVIVEVLSDATEKYDRGRKADHYRQIVALRELIFIAQDHPHVESFVRQSDGGWLFSEEKELTASFEFPSLSIGVLLSEIYRNVQFKATS